MSGGTRQRGEPTKCILLPPQATRLQSLNAQLSERNRHLEEDLIAAQRDKERLSATIQQLTAELGAATAAAAAAAPASTSDTARVQAAVKELEGGTRVAGAPPQAPGAAAPRDLRVVEAGQPLEPSPGAAPQPAAVTSPTESPTAVQLSSESPTTMPLPFGSPAAAVQRHEEIRAVDPAAGGAQPPPPVAFQPHYQAQPEATSQAANVVPSQLVAHQATVQVPGTSEPPAATPPSPGAAQAQAVTQMQVNSDQPQAVTPPQEAAQAQQAPGATGSAAAMPTPKAQQMRPVDPQLAKYVPCTSCCKFFSSFPHTACITISN